MIACVESDGTKCTMIEKSGREWCDGLVHCEFHNITPKVVEKKVEPKKKVTKKMT